MSISRRQFIRRFSATIGCSVATVSLTGLAGCATGPAPRTLLPGTSPRYRFPQGIASADPHPDAVVLWTRVVDNEAEAAVPLILQIAVAPSFDRIALESTMQSEPQLDQTLRVFAHGLDPSRWYWYRFVTPDGYSSPVGRTCTAPAENAEEQLSMAVFSCQSFENGFFNSYQRLIADDAARPIDEQTRLCLHVGDWYYENVGGSMASMSEVEPRPVNADGTPRSNRGLPSGGIRRGRRRFAHTLDDFRFLHRQNLSDAALRRARALYPFVYVWDDHEVRNDYWQSYDNAGGVQKNKLAANQAWFEYCPAALSRAAAGPAGENPARDFVPTVVDNAMPGDFDDNFLSLEENNLKAIGSMTIYRTLSWGRTADLLLVDGRSYRGKRGVDDGALGNEAVAYPSAPVDPRVVDILSAGRTANGGEPPDMIEVQGQAVPNPRRDTPATSMLGGAQKHWLKRSLVNSNARWKVLCNNVPMMRFGFDSSFTEHGVENGIYFSDSWDGYPTERNELMRFIAEQRIANVISLTGDRHAHYAGLVYDDYQDSVPEPVIAELVGASVSAACRQQLQERLAGSDPVFGAIAVADRGDLAYPYDRLPVLNTWMLHGADAARIFKATRDERAATDAANPAVNPHLAYADNDAYGFLRVVFHADRCHGEFVTEPQPVVDHTESEDPPVRRRILVDVPAVAPGEPPRLNVRRVIGEPPMLGLRTAST